MAQGIRVQWEDDFDGRAAAGTGVQPQLAVQQSGALVQADEAEAIFRCVVRVKTNAVVGYQQAHLARCGGQPDAASGGAGVQDDVVQRLLDNAKEADFHTQRQRARGPDELQTGAAALRDHP